MKPNPKKYCNINAEDAQFISDIKAIVYTAKQKAYQAADLFQVAANWLVGRKIVEQEQHGSERAEYGKRIIELASEALTAEYGKGYSLTQIKNFKKFYLMFRGLDIQQSPLVESAQISQTASDQSSALTSSKSQTPSDQFEIRYNLPNLSWSHYERLLRVKDENERDWYIKEAAEFLGFSQDTAYSETNLESAIINHLQKFILELGKGFAFVARQQRIKTDMGEYYIDLVFYNYILKCFLLIDLKSSQISYEDVGQMDMYIRMYDELKCSREDNPTIGLLLCSETSKDLARYSILKDSKQIYAAKYFTYLPTKEQLSAEIERQKEIFDFQIGKKLD